MAEESNYSFDGEDADGAAEQGGAEQSDAEEAEAGAGSELGGIEYTESEPPAAREPSTQEDGIEVDPEAPSSTGADGAEPDGAADEATTAPGSDAGSEGGDAPGSDAGGGPATGSDAGGGAEEEAPGQEVAVGGETSAGEDGREDSAPPSASHAPPHEAAPGAKSSKGAAEMSTAEATALAMELLGPSDKKPGTILQQVSAQPMSKDGAQGSMFSSRQGSGTGSSAQAPADAKNALPAGPNEPAPPPPPRYLHPTMVMPKPALQEYRNADKEHIGNVWSTGTTLSRGIRSLPNAMSPDFRIKLYDEIIEGAKREKNGQGPMNKALGMAYGNEAGPAAYQLAAGQRSVPKEHPYAGTFSTFEHLPSEYDRQQLIAKFERLKKKLRQIHPIDFIVKGTPSGPKSAPAFSEYDYPVNPYEGLDNNVRAEDTALRARVVSGPFLAGGKPGIITTLRGQANECMMTLCKQLSSDWPSAFLQTFEDRSGSIVISFDKTEALSQGDLGVYMNNFSKCNHLVSDFKLLKDASQWGLVDADTQTIFYVLWPPWVRHRFFGSPAAEYVLGAEQ